MDEIEAGIWQHYKGKRYLVLGTARHTETDEELVVYVPLYEHPDGGRALQCRPVKMWTELVTHYGTTKPRFQHQGSRLNPEPKGYAE